MVQPPKTVTALRARGRGRVAVELDGAPWRTLPVEPVLRSGIAAGVTLDRERARGLARELRRAGALARAVRTLRRRDLSRRALDARLERAGVAPSGRREALEVLERAGAVDDDRFAAARASSLAERGYGDEWIRWDLERRGVSPESAAQAIAALEPEGDRARRLAEARGGGAVASRFLARRGFGDDARESAEDPIGGDGTGAVG
jgi:SOS response regulatory protein OraA/RecX